MRSHFVERWFFPDETAGQIKKPPYWVADCVLADGMRDGLMNNSLKADVHPFGAPLASKLGCKPRLSNGGSFQTNPPDK
jgi:hypothetical protein